jgi:UV DNA damage endonuclease
MRLWRNQVIFMVRLGFPVRIVGKPALRSQPPQRGGQHLSIGLMYLRDILTYLQRINVSFYRMAASLLPPVPSLTGSAEVWQQLQECRAELHSLAQQVRQQKVRLSTHLEHHILLGSADDATTSRSIATIEAQAALLDHLDEQGEAVIIIHAGGGCQATLERFATRYHRLSARARRRLVIEHVPGGASLSQLLLLHQACGVPVVFDYLHYQLANAEQLPLGVALGLAFATWPRDMRPKVHLSTARSEAHLVPAQSGQTARILPPRPGQHADFVASSDMLSLLQAARGLGNFDVMLEAKAGDLALLRLRAEFAQVAPHLASMVA